MRQRAGAVPRGGEIILDGITVTIPKNRPAEAGRPLASAWLFQAFRAVPHLTIVDNSACVRKRCSDDSQEESDGGRRQSC